MKDGILFRAFRWVVVAGLFVPCAVFVVLLWFTDKLVGEK